MAMISNFRDPVSDLILDVQGLQIDTEWIIRPIPIMINRAPTNR